MDEFMYAVIGRMVVDLVFVILVVIAVFLIIGFLISLIIALSFRRGKVYFPRLMLFGISVLEVVVRPTLRLFSMDSSSVDMMGIELRNRVSIPRLRIIPRNRRAIFFPQCLRSKECPARLTPEGVVCVGCGRCEIGRAKMISEKKGYKVFIAPGSSVIKRMIKKYNIQGVIGVACKREVREGLELCGSYGIPAIGIPLSKDGCVETLLDWGRFYEVIEELG